MKQTNLVQSISIQTQLSIDRFFKCLYLAIGLCIVTILYIEIPFLWRIYQQKSYCKTKKEVYTLLQKLVAEQKKIHQKLSEQSSLKNIVQEKKIDKLVYFVLKPSKEITITHFKQTRGKATLQGYGKTINLITAALQNAQQRVDYTITINSLEKNEQHGYAFHALCKRKRIKQ